MKNTILLVAAFLLSFPLFAQVRVLGRAEFPTERRESANFSVINLNEKGVMTVFETPSLLREGKREMRFALNDTTLSKKWERSLALDAEETILLHKIKGDRLFMLIGKPVAEHRLITFDLADGHFSFDKLQKVMDLEVSHFEIIDEIVFLGGTAKNSPVILRYEPNGRAFKAAVLPGINNLSAVLTDLRTDVGGQLLCASLKNKHASTPMLYFNMFAKDGKPAESWMQGPEKEFFILAARAYVPQAGRQFLFGTYSAKMNGKAQGIFTALYENNEQSVIRKYDFAYLKNFFNFLTDKQKERLFRKIEKKRLAKKTYRLDFNLFVREPEFRDGKIYLALESYRPVYKDRNNDPMSFTDRMDPRRFGNVGLNTNSFLSNYSERLSRAPNGYRYVHAAVFGFDKNGLLEWDNSFTYKDLESQSAEEFAAFRPGPKGAAVLHLQKDKLYFKQPIGSEKAEQQELPVEVADSLTAKTVKIIDREDEVLSAWYGDKFLIYGVQKLRDELSGKNRFVFYLSKLDLNGVLKEESEADKDKSGSREPKGF